MFRRQLSRATGFTLTEFLVLIGIGSVLAGLLLADLTQTRTKLLQQACAANLQHWGMAINLYSQDYNGTYYGYNTGPFGWDDSTSPYAKYLVGSNSVAAIRMARLCPFIAGQYSLDQIINTSVAGHSYTMSDPLAKWTAAGPFYRQATGSGAVASSPYVVMDPNTGVRFDLPSLKDVPNRSTFLLVMDGGNTMHCGGLYARATTFPTSGPPIKPCDRHGGNVNCLFGDFHVELVSTQTLANVDTLGGCVGSTTGNPWFNMN